MRMINRHTRMGAALFIVMAVILTAMAIAAYAINVAHMQYTRAELQIAADVATRAACRALVDTNSRSAAYREAQRLADANPVGGRKMQIESGDLEFLAATRDSEMNAYRYQPDAQPNAVRFQSTFFTRAENSLPMLVPSLTMTTSFRPAKESIATQADIDMAIVLDCSTSMMFDWNIPAPPESLLLIPLPVPPNARWRIAESGIHACLDSFVNSPGQEQVALVTFNTLSALNVPLSTNYELVKGGVALQGNAYLGGQSSLSAGLTSGLTLLSNRLNARPWACRVILLISDGKENFGETALSVAHRAAAAHVMIYTISVSSEADQPFMRSLANATLGKHFHCATPEQFVEVIKEIRTHLPVLITY